MDRRGITAFRAGGFSLIELMIVVAIIAILGAIAIPNYKAYVDRGKRSEGRALLAEVANRMERFYSDCNAYPTNLTTAGSNNCTSPGTVVVASTTGENNYYAVTVGGLDANRQNYTLTATPQWPDAACNNLTLDNTGARNIVGGDGTKTRLECWGK